ncbi:MAG: type II toxin-antitoxin system VapC family toxin [Firmicutes bacterium]|nr:type II toxin-antitoxin system VapC family toxin [Bacillota bacterium]
MVLSDSDEADELAEAYLQHGIVGPGSRSDALHVALATIAEADVLVGWNFKHMVNIGKIRLFSAVNLERGYRPIDIRSPKEVLPNGKGF